MINLVIGNILAVSLLSNAALCFYLYKLRKKLKQKKPDATAQEVLAEIMAGPAVLKIDVVERDSLIQWRPH